MFPETFSKKGVKQNLSNCTRMYLLLNTNETDFAHHKGSTITYHILRDECNSESNRNVVNATFVLLTIQLLSLPHTVGFGLTYRFLLL